MNITEKLREIEIERGCSKVRENLVGKISPHYFFETAIQNLQDQNEIRQYYQECLSYAAENPEDGDKELVRRTILNLLKYEPQETVDRWENSLSALLAENKNQEINQIN
ncbi:hypothetical protein HYV50_05185 [Candidatus Pacearchaeota archaeon]|nr:hypothetical protein [Candidatus Pacearchaeota archaeon]